MKVPCLPENSEVGVDPESSVGATCGEGLPLSLSSLLWKHMWGKAPIVSQLAVFC